jgi:hypothetical protein
MSKELLGSLSPIYGMATGHGLFGKEVGVLPAIAKDMRDDKKKEEDKAKGMKKGGAVKMSSASKRADGIATKGKTKGRIV